MDITVTMPDSRATVYWKCTANGLAQMPLVSLNGNSMVIRLTDGGPGDADGLANGVIVDPGGPGLPVPVSLDTAPVTMVSPHSSAAVMQPVNSPNVMQPINLPTVVAQKATQPPGQGDSIPDTANGGGAAGEGFVIAVMGAFIVAISVVLIMLWKRRSAY